MRAIGILSGSFDPVHFGHVRMAEYFAKFVPLDEVLFIPLPCAEHRQSVASIAQRRAMALLATEHHPFISVPDIQLKQSTSAVYDIVRKVQEMYQDARIYYIIGADRLPGMQYWKNAKELLQLCEFLVYPRPGYNLQQLAELPRINGARIHIAPASNVFISAEFVRRQISLLNDAPDLLNPKVIHYIARNGLYLPDYENLLKPSLNVSRLLHTISVRETAVDLAQRHGIPLLKASVAAMLHDCAKCMSLSELRQLAVKNRLTDDQELLSSAAMLHGIVGAFIARERFHIEDEDILNAITYHTMGRRGMSALELCIFVADTIEPRRHPFPGLQKIRNLAQVDLRAAALACLESTQQHIFESGGNYSNKSLQAMEELASLIYHKGEHHERKRNVYSVS